MPTVNENSLRSIVIEHEGRLNAMCAGLKPDEPVFPSLSKKMYAMIDAVPNPEARVRLVTYARGLMRARYLGYLMSDKWKRKRLAVLKRDRNLCQGCLSRDATQVHHLTYDNLGDELAFELVALCDPCHARLHERTIDDLAQTISAASRSV